MLDVTIGGDKYRVEIENGEDEIIDVFTISNRALHP